ncbi:aldose epimerase [Hylemonella gracilis str. Niagara R]|uniref:Aldose epimerase n=1 Tax=Hylemonella gracilis str. Niagara R TaxID=1458275 RepID=A0A016XFV6_9BURK|nr:aldose 1-epimerase [Hylemonella gracilis]EYC50721.1 aldose epimerase [Hylemonella gracilis str. Niagara R]
MSTPAHPVVWLHHAGQHLGLVPTLGGGMAAWQVDHPSAPQGRLDLLRPWDGHTPDQNSLASFAMVPWSNRISGGGFEQDGRFHPMQPNRAGEPYPIHGDGWLQPWTLSQPAPDTLEMSLRSRGFQGNPYDYEAVQTFRLVQGGLDQEVRLSNLGAQPLPHGIGLHPWFPRTPRTRVTAPVQGVWLSGKDPLPVGHTTQYPDGWDLNQGVLAHGDLIDNGYSGWGGQARIEWPEHGLALDVHMPDFEQDGGAAQHFCLIYRPPQGPAFCFEPITQPIDAFHLPGRPGLRVLGQGESMTLRVCWRLAPLAQA